MKHLLAFIIFIQVFCGIAAQQKLSLAGNWRFELDRDDVGLAGH